MNYPRWASIALAALLASHPWLNAQAQSAPPARSAAADYIVAVVNSEPITHSELNAALRRAQEQLRAQGRPLPAAEALRQQVLEQLITDRALVQHANESGIRIDDQTLDQAEKNVAQQNQTDLPTFLQRLANDGVDAKTFRKQLREQITLSRVREREVESQVRITDRDLDAYLAERQARQSDPFAQEINLAQILVALPEKAGAEQAAQLFLQAQRLQQRAAAGEDFNALVNQYSAADKANGGQIGLRGADRYPETFVNATAALAVGAVSEVVRTGAGFHILKVVEKRQPKALSQTIVQTRVRHILLRASADLNPAQARARLVEIRQAIVSGRATFEAMARQHSQDGSASQGGDLGWVPPGAFVPEFEAAMNRLQESEISAPTESRFGMHLIQVQDRRRVALSPTEVRELARNELRQIKLDEAFNKWMREIRERAFVDLREPPV